MRGILIAGGTTGALVLAAVWTLGEVVPRRSTESTTTASSVREVVRAPSSTRDRDRRVTHPRRPRVRAIEPTLQELWARRAQESSAAHAQASTAPSPADEVAAADARALSGFTAAFETDGSDRAWSDQMEASITEALATTPQAPVLEAVECRATLCRIELHGTMDMLPFAEPFTSTNAWWIDGDDGTGTLLLARDVFDPVFTG